MKAIVIDHLKSFADVCIRVLQIIPLYVVQIVLILVMMGLAIWVIMLKEETPRSSPEYSNQKRGSIGSTLFLDLRFWAVLLLIIQCVLIVVFK